MLHKRFKYVASRKKIMKIAPLLLYKYEIV